MEDVLNTKYWETRLNQANEVGILHRSIFLCDSKRWTRIEETHKNILNNLISPKDSILDVGCGWGRLINLLPDSYKGVYTGVDLYHGFIKIANQNIDKYRKKVPLCTFVAASIVDWLQKEPKLKYDWAILVSFRPMIIRNCSEEYWNQIHGYLKRDCKKILYLEYDPNDKGVIE